MQDDSKQSWDGWLLETADRLDYERASKCVVCGHRMPCGNPRCDRPRWWAKYREYLKSEQWQATRRVVLERDKGLCQGCLLLSANTVHHLSYDNVGRELLYQLVSLCAECHKRAHADDAEFPGTE